MKRLYSPWRKQYVARVRKDKNYSVDSKDCTFCIQFAAQEDERNFILKRFDTTIVMLNLYPYNAGHLLILPLIHKAVLSELSLPTRSELMELLCVSNDILREVINAEGINVGINLGKAAGAGIPSHLHFHSVPRWLGDTNFLPLIAETKQISVDLNEFYRILKPAFDAITL